MSFEKTICEKCGKERRSELQSSFTQWIFDRDSCACDAPHNAVKPAPQSSQFCPKCGRPISVPREGSMTQWIFRSVPCSCSQAATEVAIEESEIEDWEELALDPKHFPLDRYKPLEELGAGTSGKVYLCIDRLLKKKVAVKTLRTLSTEQFLAFQTEARATSRLKHPAILNLLDFGPTEGGEPYMVLEYFDSQTLTGFILANGSLDARTVQQIFMPIASALSMSHSMGIFHRDLKPQNILISSSGNQFEVKLIDFGTATVTAFAEAGQTTQSTSLVGTPAYMSPDCASGLPFDARSDIYSLGCVMFECLAGRPPFEGITPVDLLSQHAQVTAPSLHDFEIECPDAVANMVARCLEKNREKRFQSMEELVETLAGLNISAGELAEEDTPEEFTSIKVESPKASGDKKRKFLHLLGASVSVFILLGIGLATTLLIQEETGPAVTPMNMVAHQLKWKAPEYPERFTDAHLKLLVGKRIKRLHLDNTQISAEGLRLISKEPIEALSLGSTLIDLNIALPMLAKMKQLKTLRLSALGMNNQKLLLLKGLHLATLDLENNKDINNDSIPILARLFPDLTGLYIARTSVTNDGVCQLKRFKELHGVNLSVLEVDDSAMTCLLDLPLKTVEIHMSPITNKGFLTLGKNPTITTIKVLGSLNVNDEGVAQMKKLRPDIRVVMDHPSEDLNLK